MSDSIDFYFDFSSPFGYIASERIEAIAKEHGRQVVWHPVLLGAVFKVSGQEPLLQIPLKGDYSLHDINRCAREHQIDYTHPASFPIATVSACRATVWMRDHEDASISGRTADFIHAAFRAYFAKAWISLTNQCLAILPGHWGSPPNKCLMLLTSRALRMRCVQKSTMPSPQVFLAHQ